MAQYLVAVYRPDDYDPSVETEAMIEGIHALCRRCFVRNNDRMNDPAHKTLNNNKGRIIK